MASNQDIQALVHRIPDPNKGGTYADLTEQSAKQIDQVVAQLRAGGAESVLGVIDLLVEPGKGDDIKPHFALHVLAVRVSAPGNEKDRAVFARTLAAQLAADRPPAVKSYLIEQLQVAGGKEALAALGKVLRDPVLCDTAARALAAIGDGAAEQLLAALPDVQGASHLSVLKKLAFLRVKAAAGAFRKALADRDADVRIAAGWGLARLADASAADAMLKAADAHQGWERINLTDACMSLAEALVSAREKATAARIYKHLAETRGDAAEKHVRRAAKDALAAIQ